LFFPLFYIINWFYVAIETFGDFPHFYIFESTKEGYDFSYGSDWTSYSKTNAEAPRKGYLREGNLDWPKKSEATPDDDRLPVHQRNVLRKWISSTVQIPDRVDITGSKKNYFHHFFYTYTKNDNILRLIRLYQHPGSVENFPIDFSNFSADYMTRIDGRLELTGERPFLALGHYKSEVVAVGSRTEMFGGLYKDTSWLYPNAKGDPFARSYYANGGGWYKPSHVWL